MEAVEKYGRKQPEGISADTVVYLLIPDKPKSNPEKKGKPVTEFFY